MTPPAQRRPLPAVAAIVRDTTGRVILGKRKASLGQGEWGLPGGHLEFGESIQDCAERETLEETGLRVKAVKTIGATSSVFPELGKHYITLFVVCRREDENEQAQVLEPNKCEGWHWKTWTEVKSMADGRAGPSDRLFKPMVNFVEENPDIESLVQSRFQ